MCAVSSEVCRRCGPRDRRPAARTAFLSGGGVVPERGVVLSCVFPSADRPGAQTKRVFTGRSSQSSTDAGATSSERDVYLPIDSFYFTLNIK